MADKGTREAARQRLLADVDILVAKDDTGSLDIDEVAKEALEMPTLPPPSLTLEDIDRVMNRDDLRPPQVDWRSLDPGSYAFSMPGFPTSVRVTTRAETFDDHFENHEFLGPGNKIYEQLIHDMSEQPTDSRPQSINGKATPAVDSTSPFQWTADTEVSQEINTLNDLLIIAEHQPAVLRLTTQLGTVLAQSGETWVALPQPD